MTAYLQCDCNITNACKQSGVGRRTFYNWMKEDSTFLDDVVNTKESLIDDVETALLMIARGYKKELTYKTQDANGKKVMSKKEIYIQPNIQAIKLFLEAKARNRGYGMKPDDSDADQHADDE